MSATEKQAKPTVTIMAAISKAYHDVFAEDPKVITLGEDLADPEGGGIVKIASGHRPFRNRPLWVLPSAPVLPVISRLLKSC